MLTSDFCKGQRLACAIAFLQFPEKVGAQEKEPLRS